MNYGMKHNDITPNDYDPMISFNPHDYIELMTDGFARCRNPFADSGLTDITVNTQLFGENLRNFESSIKRMVLSKLFSPKFAEIILTATRLQQS